MKNTEVQYTCNVCGKKELSRKALKSCVQKHWDDKKAGTTPKGAIVCPKCKGVGGTDGVDMVDFYTCFTCEGTGFVIPTKDE